MNTQTWMNGPPTRILLATDLSARSDRTLDRAVQLAGQWSSELVVLNVLEASPAPDMALAMIYGEEGVSNEQIVQRELQQDIAGLDIQPIVKIARGDAAESIRTIAVDNDCDLIVTGMARNETFGRFLLGTTVEKLVRMVYQPLLVVRNRPRKPYRKVVVATDFSDSSRHALHAAAQFFPDCELIIYHACKIPLSGLADGISTDRVGDDVTRNECAVFLENSVLSDDLRKRLKVVVEYGVLETTLTHYVRKNAVDLVVMGTHGRSGLMSILLGSLVARMLNWLPCDTMIVRDPHAPII
jgi:nucleotide-binding universal stress UspA family protein